MADTPQSDPLVELINRYREAPTGEEEPEAPASTPQLDPLVEAVNTAKQRPGLGETFGIGVQQGVGQIKSALPMLEATYYEARGDLDASAEAILRARAIEQALPQSVVKWEDIADPEDFMYWATERLGEQAPILGTMAMTGGVGSLLASLVGRRLLTTAAARALATKTGGVLGVGVSNVGLETAGTAAEQFASTGSTQPGTSVSAGLLKGALETWAPFRFMKELHTDPLLKLAGRTAGREAFTEWLQEEVDIGARTLNDPTYGGFFSKDAWSRRAQSATAGGLVGVVYGTGGGVIGKLAGSGHPGTERTLTPKEMEEILRKAPLAEQVKDTPMAHLRRMAEPPDQSDGTPFQNTLPVPYEDIAEASVPLAGISLALRGAKMQEEQNDQVRNAVDSVIPRYIVEGIPKALTASDLNEELALLRQVKKQPNITRVDLNSLQPGAITADVMDITPSRIMFLPGVSPEVKTQILSEYEAARPEIERLQRQRTETGNAWPQARAQLETMYESWLDRGMRVAPAPNSSFYYNGSYDGQVVDAPMDRRTIQTAMMMPGQDLREGTVFKPSTRDNEAILGFNRRVAVALDTQKVGSENMVLMPPRNWQPTPDDFIINPALNSEAQLDLLTDFLLFYQQRPVDRNTPIQEREQAMKLLDFKRRGIEVKHTTDRMLSWELVLGKNLEFANAVPGVGYPTLGDRLVDTRSYVEGVTPQTDLVRVIESPAADAETRARTEKYKRRAWAMQRVLKGIFRRMGIPWRPVIIITEEPIASHRTDSNPTPYMHLFEGAVVIPTWSSLIEDKGLWNLSVLHEVGHWITLRSWEKLPSDLKLRVYNGYQRALLAYRITGEPYKTKMSFGPSADIRAVAQANRNRYYKFSEYMAEQFRRWASSNPAVLSDVEHWYNSMGANILNFYRYYAETVGPKNAADMFTPDFGFTKWMDYLHEVAEQTGGHALRLMARKKEVSPDYPVPMELTEVLQAVSDILKQWQHIVPGDVLIDFKEDYSTVVSPDGTSLVRYGHFDQLNRTLTLYLGSLAQMGNVKAIKETIGHELFHSVQDVLNDKETEILRNKGQERKLMSDAELAYYRDYLFNGYLSTGLSHEEASRWVERAISKEYGARMMEARARGESYGGLVDQILDALWQLIEAIQNLIRTGDFKTADSIARAFYRGEVTRRYEEQSTLQIKQLMGAAFDNTGNARSSQTKEFEVFPGLSVRARYWGRGQILGARYEFFTTGDPQSQLGAVDLINKGQKGWLVEYVWSDGQFAKDMKARSMLPGDIFYAVWTQDLSEATNTEVYEKPAGHLLPAGYRMWQRWAPDRVKWYVQDNSGDWWSPNKIEENVKHWSAIYTQAQRGKGYNDPARVKQILDRWRAAQQKVDPAYKLDPFQRDAFMAKEVKYKRAPRDDFNAYSKMIEIIMNMPKEYPSGKYVEYLKRAGVRDAEIEMSQIGSDVLWPTDPELTLKRDVVLRIVEKNLPKLFQKRAIRMKEGDVATKYVMDGPQWANWSYDPENPTYQSVVVWIDDEKKVYSVGGHMRQNNTVGFILLSIQRDRTGRTIGTVSQLQSDWGQAIRDQPDDVTDPTELPIAYRNAINAVQQEANNGSVLAWLYLQSREFGGTNYASQFFHGGGLEEYENVYESEYYGFEPQLEAAIFTKFPHMKKAVEAYKAAEKAYYDAREKAVADWKIANLRGPTESGEDNYWSWRRYDEEVLYVRQHPELKKLDDAITTARSYAAAAHGQLFTQNPLAEPKLEEGTDTLTGTKYVEYQPQGTFVQNIAVSELANMDSQMDDRGEVKVALHPYMNTTDQWVSIMLNRLIQLMVDLNVDAIATPTGQMVLTYNPGQEAGMEGFYDKIVPFMLKDKLQGYNGGKIKTWATPSLLSFYGSKVGVETHSDGVVSNAALQGVNLPDVPDAPYWGRGHEYVRPEKGFHVFELTPAIKAKVKALGVPMLQAKEMQPKDVVKKLARDGHMVNETRKGMEQSDAEVSKAITGEPNPVAHDEYEMLMQATMDASQREAAELLGVEFEQAAPKQGELHHIHKMFNWFKKGQTPAQRHQIATIQAEADRITWFSKKWWGLQQLAFKNKQNKELQRYTQLVEMWNAYRMDWITKADQVARSWEDIGPEQADKISDLVFWLHEMEYRTRQEKAQNVVRHPTPQELQAKVQAMGLSPEAMAVHQRIEGIFNDFLNSSEAALMADISRTFAANPQGMAAAQAELSADMAALRARPYFPTVAFGEHTVTIKDQGKTVWFSAYPTEREAMNALPSIIRRFPGTTNDDVILSRVPDSSLEFLGIPGPVLRYVRINLPGTLTQQQLDWLERFEHAHSPLNSFKKRWLKSSGTPGYSMDALRTFAHYFQNGANYLARLQFNRPLIDQVSAQAAKMQAPGMQRSDQRRNVKASMVYEYMNEHRKYIMEPGHDWGKFRALVGMWQLGFSVAAAVMNMTQTATATIPTLSGIFGSGVTASAFKRFNSAIKVGGPGLPSKHLTPDYISARDEMIAQGKIEAGQAPELGAFAEGGNLTRLSAGALEQKAFRFMSYWSMMLFGVTERFNRDLAFAMAYDLAMKDPNNQYLKDLEIERFNEVGSLMTRRKMTVQQAVATLFGREIIDMTQFVYAPWARPTFLRNPLMNSMLVFFAYTQNMLFALGNNPGKYKMIATLLALYGIAGLPFSDDLDKILKWLSRKLGWNFSPHEVARETMRDLTRGTIFDKVGPDLLMHGISRYSFGLGLVGEGYGAPRFDASLNGSMGKIIPGLSDALQVAASGGDWDKMTARLGQDVAGAGFGQVFAFLQFMDRWGEPGLKKWELIMPRAVKAWSRTYRYATDGREQTRGGATISRFHMTDPDDIATLVTQALGFNPTKNTMAYEVRNSIQDYQDWVKSRRMALYMQMDHAVRTGDKGGKADVAVAINKFNAEMKELGLPGAGINMKKLNQSLKGRTRARALQERMLPMERGMRPLTGKMRDLYPGVVDERPVK